MKPRLKLLLNLHLDLVGIYKVFISTCDCCECLKYKQCSSKLNSKWIPNFTYKDEKQE